jgi:hypothetical protein
MTDEQKALYKQEKVDGKGRLQFFVSCWDGLQLLFQKFMKQGKARGDGAFDCMLALSRDLMGCSFWRTGRLIAFKKIYGPELQELFPSPPEQLCEETFVQKLKAALTPICVESMTEMEATHEGGLRIVANDWPSFLLFKAEYQAFTSTDYYSHHTQMSGGMTVKRFYCR